MAIIMDIKEITSMEISIIGVTIGHSMEMQAKILVIRKTGSSRLQGEKLDRGTQPPTSNFEKFMGKGGRIFYLCKI
jgi:hypothetical protein